LAVHATYDFDNLKKKMKGWKDEFAKDNNAMKQLYWFCFDYLKVVDEAYI
jgi:hypothetical protein